MPVLTPEEYRKRASEIYDPSYAVKIANENTAFNNTMAQYQDQATQVNSNTDKSLQANTRNTALNQNQYNNNTLSRGMARSSIATTGLAGIQNTGNRVAGEIEQDRSQQLNNLETLKSNLRASLESTLKGMSSEREGGINSLAMQLQQRDEDVQRQLDQQAEDKRRYDQEWAFKQQQYADQKAAQAVSARKSSGSSSSKSSSGGLTASQISTYKKQIESEMTGVSPNPTERENWIQQNAQQILAATGGDTNYIESLIKKAREGASYYYGTRASLH